MSGNNQFVLLRKRRFSPFFVAQALGAFNDNLLKNALTIVATYQAASYGGIPPDILANVTGGVFILPFVLLSGFAGQLADRLDKTLVIRAIKAAEIPIMALAGIGFLSHQLVLLLTALFLMGVHSTFFAPAKYGLLPQILGSRELIGGNALLESGTFLAILLGTLAAGLMAAAGSIMWMSVFLTGIALLGFVVALLIPRTPAVAPSQPLDWNPWRSTMENLRVARESRSVWLSLLGLSWFWFYGALVLAQLPLYCQTILHGDASLVALTMIVFSVGVGIGSLLCEKLSGHEVEIGLVPFGSIGLSLFAVDWAFATPRIDSATLISIPQLLSATGGVRILVDIAAIGVFGGFFVVPLYALVQQRSRPEALSRVIGANSILNALFMIAASLFGAVALSNGVDIPQLILLTAILNALVAGYIYALVPEFLLRFAAWLLVHTIYRLSRRNPERVPEKGAALLVSNRVSVVDALVLSASFKRPIRFVLNESVFKAPLIGTLARSMKAIPVPAVPTPHASSAATQAVAQALRAGQLVCFFQEGQMSGNEHRDEFLANLMPVLDRAIPVIPVTIAGLQGSLFARRAAGTRLSIKPWARVTVRVGESMDGIAVNT